jgi:glutathione synthase/RimK-type ligase-like ATP-grasp enzyme
MNRIVALCDYKGNFGSKYFSQPYRSGMDRQVLQSIFTSLGHQLEFCRFVEIYKLEDIQDSVVIYTGQEDPGFYYRSYIEDCILSLDLQGVQVIPSYQFLRAYNNKVFMEMLRRQLLPERYQLWSRQYGCRDELMSQIAEINFPVVVKSSAGAGSRGVFIAQDSKELTKISKRVSRTRNFKEEIWDIGREKKYPDYAPISRYRMKFIVQEYVPGLNNDWKVLVFYDRFYVLRRNNRPHDFRASGSGLFSFDKEVDHSLLDAAYDIYRRAGLPMISLDLAKAESRIILIEMQFVAFGTSTLEKSPYYCQRTGQGWEQVFRKSVLEEEYARSISQYLKEKKTVQ